MKVGTDAVLLGAWVDIGENCKTILDIGTGCGVIALMLAQKTNAEIIGIDIDEKSILEAQQNASQIDWKNHLSFIHKKLQDFSQQRTQKFDLIVTNPPFFENSLKSPDFNINLSKHTDNLTFEELIEAVSLLLAENGQFTVILPFNIAEKFVKIAAEKLLFIAKKTIIFPTPNKKPNRVLLEFTKTKNEIIENELTIRNINQTYTTDYKNLSKEYYL